MEILYSAAVRPSIFKHQHTLGVNFILHERASASSDLEVANLIFTTLKD